MATTSVDGLISGLNTTDVITQLMQLERQPQARLKTQRSALDKTTAAYQSLNARFDSLLKAASAVAQDSGWQVRKATSSDSTILKASAQPTAAGGELAVSVERLASAHALVSEATVSGLGTVVATGPLQLTVGGQPAAPIAVGDGTLSSVVAAVNAAGAGVRAVAVQVSPGQYRLQLTATATGAAGAFTVDPTGLSALADPGAADPEAFDVVTQGADAELKVGGPAGYTINSAGNTFTDLLPGVTLTAAKAAPGTFVTVGIEPDADAVVTKVKALVTAVNGAFSFITSSTGYDASTGTKGLLLGDGLTRRLQQDLYGALRLDTAGSLADVGLKIGAGGLELDEEAFRAAYTADPQAVVHAFTGSGTALAGDGLATKLEALGTRAAHPSTGLVSLAIVSAGSKAVDLDRLIEAWDVRLATRESALKKQFSTLERALGTLQSQGSWLAGQISGLPSWGS